MDRLMDKDLLPFPGVLAISVSEIPLFPFPSLSSPQQQEQHPPILGENQDDEATLAPLERSVECQKTAKRRPLIALSF